MNGPRRGGGIRGARASLVLVVSSRHDELQHANIREKLRGFSGAVASGSSRRRDAFANTRDARAPRSSLPGALDDRERLPHVFGDAEFSTVLSGRRILLAH